jgi:hypothetical protein
MTPGPDKRRLVAVLREHLEDEARSADAARREEITRLLLIYRFLPLRDLTDQDVAAPAALVGLEINGHVSYAFITPQGGGLITEVDGFPVQVVTPQSPMGEALLGKKVGEEARVSVRGGERAYRVVSIR